MGAVSLLPEDVPPPNEGETRVRTLSEKELEEIVAELPRRPLMAGREGLRLSLAGSQSKLPVLIRDAAIALPLGNTPSTHIIKPEPERFPGLVATEAFCMTLARVVGLNVPPVTVRSVGNKPCLVVQRYDRIINVDGSVRRVHQEDFCQALGFPPERKYQQEGGPLLRDCIGLLREWSTVAALDIRDFLDGLIFNVKAADGTWLGTQDNVWVNDANWDAETYPGMASGQTATFDSAVTEILCWIFWVFPSSGT